MPVTVSYPGVYVQEQASGARAIAGVATSVALFVGMARQGPLEKPVQIFSVADFEREFGSETGGELADQITQFYLNGGSTAWVVRIADGAVQADVMLRDEAGIDCLRLTARDAGEEGNLIRAEVDYETGSPERTFNLTVFKSRLLDSGDLSREDETTYESLSMDPASGTYVQNVLINGGGLVTAEVQTANAPALNGISISGRVLPATEADVDDELQNYVTSTNNAIRISVDNNPPVRVTLDQMANIANSDTIANIATAWQTNINNALTSQGIGAAVTVEITGTGVANDSVEGGRLLTISSAGGPVVISQAVGNDASVALMLGVAAGGIEGDSFGDFRPAPTGVVSRSGRSTDNFDHFRNFASADRAELTTFNLVDDSADSPHSAAVAVPGATRMHDDAGDLSLLNARNALDILASTIDVSANTSGRWNAGRHGIRVALSPNYGNVNTGLAAVMTSIAPGTYDIGAADQPFEAATNPENVASYTLGMSGGAGGLGGYQDGVGAAPGDDGNVPLPGDYDDAYEIVDKDVDLFNMLVLPRAEGQGSAAQQALWGAASAFCTTKRAMLIIDPPDDWTDVASARTGIDAIRIGVETRNAAAYWPKLRVADGTPAGRAIAPSGSMAGLWARTDANRGVWKAPAGLEATIRGVTGVERTMSDLENGVLNPKALNALRIFPAGVVSWGARNLIGFDGSGDIDNKYVPVRRTMLFIEESLYRGLQFAVFEPNDEPLWSQIRLAAGSFMNGLFRQGAFAGATARDAYFVRCDSTTTTPNDINLGIVNVIVGFAPLKPAEFVILTVTQIAGQAEV